MPQDLKPLTALRFFAAVWVVMYHVWPSLGLATPALVGKGYLGVELFFTLSGFILAHVYLDGFGEGRFKYADFLWARLARLYPVHLVTLAGLGLIALLAAAVGLHAGEKLLYWPALLPNLLLIHAWSVVDAPGWNHPSWSISAEWFAYLTFPAFAFAAWRLRRRPRLAVVLAVALVVAVQEAFRRITGASLTQATVTGGMIRIVPCFALGCAVNLLWRSAPIQGERAAGAAAAASLLAIGVAIGLAAPDWAAAIVFGGLIFSLASLSSAGSKVLTHKAWVYLGEVSFAVYMVCIPWQVVVENAAHKLLHVQGAGLPFLAWLAMLAGVLPAAMALHHLVERPARAAMRRHGAPFKGLARLTPFARPALQA